MLFTQLHYFALILKCTDSLIKNETDGEQKTLHEKNIQRIRNYAICEMAMRGYEHSFIESHGTRYLSINIEGTEYMCPESTWKNVTEVRKKKKTKLPPESAMDNLFDELISGASIDNDRVGKGSSKWAAASEKNKPEREPLKGKDHPGTPDTIDTVKSPDTDTRQEEQKGASETKPGHSDVGVTDPVSAHDTEEEVKVPGVNEPEPEPEPEEDTTPAPKDFLCRHTHHSKFLDKSTRDVMDEVTFVVWPLAMPYKPNVTMTEIAVYAKHGDEPAELFISQSSTNPIIAASFQDVPGVTFSIRGSFEGGKFESTVIPVWDGVSLYDFGDDIDEVQPEKDGSDIPKEYAKRYRFMANGLMFYIFPAGDKDDPAVVAISGGDVKQCELCNDFINLVVDNRGTTIVAKNRWKKGVFMPEFEKKAAS